MLHDVTMDRTWCSTEEDDVSVALPWRVGVVFGNRRVHVVPGLGALDEDVGLRPEPAGIVERADPQPDEIGPGRDLHIKRRAAIAAEGAHDLVASVGFADKPLRRALDDPE